MKTILSLWQKKTEALFLGGLFFAVFIFYPDLFWAKTGMLTGDHAIQHYPWAVLLSNSLKHFQLPFWTSAIQSGFPITAEGQIGSFYPPNWFFLGLLPVKWGYSYLHVFHFLISGWGMYAYGRVIKLSPLAAFLTAFVYLFGTVYGGAYYNITSLKTLAWLPGMLWCFERFLAAGQKRYVAAVMFASAFTVLAGYLQLAIYSLGFFTLYSLLRLWVFKEPLPERGTGTRLLRQGGLFAGLAGGALLSMPQLWLTYKLAMHSTRAVSTEEFAYVGSMFPGALMTLVYPVTQGLFRGNSLYLGVLALWLIAIAVCCDKTRKEVFFKIWFCLGILSLLLALGEWSPFYVGLVKLTHFYAFRTPAKFLFFICFSLSLLVGLGFQRLERDVEEKKGSAPVKWASKIYLGLLGASAGILVFLNVGLRLGRSWFKSWGYDFVEKFFFGRMGHPHDLAVYQQKWDGYMESVLQVVTPSSAWNMAGIFFMLVGAFFAFCVLSSGKVRRGWIAGILFVFFADLYAFSWNDLRKDFSSYPQDPPSAMISRLIQAQSTDRGGRLYGIKGAEESLPLVPSQNILYGIEDIGAYSPLVSRRYLEAFGPLGNVDDSNGFQTASLPFIQTNLPLLNYLNVAHILSTQPLDLAGWNLLAREEDSNPVYLYENQNVHSEAHFISSLEIFEDWHTLREHWLSRGIDPAQALYLERSEWEKLGLSEIPDLQTSPPGDSVLPWTLAKRKERLNDVWELTVKQPGFFVRATVFDGGWQCFLNGQKTPVLAANGLFQAVWIPSAGTYQLDFRYNPFLNLE